MCAHWSTFVWWLDWTAFVWGLIRVKVVNQSWKDVEQNKQLVSLLSLFKAVLSWHCDLWVLFHTPIGAFNRYIFVCMQQWYRTALLPLLGLPWLTEKHLCSCHLNHIYRFNLSFSWAGDTSAVWIVRSAICVGDSNKFVWTVLIFIDLWPFLFPHLGLGEWATVPGKEL